MHLCLDVRLPAALGPMAADEAHTERHSWPSDVETSQVTNCLTSAKDDYSWGSLDSSTSTIHQELSNSICSSSEFFPSMMQAALSTLSATPAAPLPLSQSSSSPVKCVPPSIPIQPPLFRSLSGSHHRHIESNASKHALPTAICLGNSICRPGEHALTVISLQVGIPHTQTPSPKSGHTNESIELHCKCNCSLHSPASTK